MINRTWANFHRRGDITIVDLRSMAIQFQRTFGSYPTRVEMTPASLNWLLADEVLQQFPPEERTVAVIEVKVEMEVVIDRAIHNDVIKLVLEQEG
jgi:hypothetical protein